MRKILLTLLTCIIFCIPVYAEETVVFTTSNVNVRSGPGTEHNILTTYSSGTRVTPTSVTEDGWQQIEYQDGYAWISGDYLSEPTTIALNDDSEFEDIDELHKIYDNYGSEGRLIIPDLGMNVALNRCNPDTDIDYAQYVVDSQDSACYYTRNNTVIIGDHKNQGFSALYDTTIGEKAYILHSDGSVVELVCTRITPNGSNSEYLWDENGTMASLCSQPFIMYTCNPAGWWDVTITYWDYC